MRGTAVLLLALAVSFLTAQGTSHAQSTTTTYNASGAYAESFFTVNNSFVDLFVARGCPAPPCAAPTPGTILVWFSFNNNPDGTVSFTEGDGVIPDSAFQANNLQHMSLNVDTSKVPGFNTITCTGFTSCTNGPFGVMQASWQQTDQTSTTNNEDTTTASGPFSTSIHNDQTYSSALGSGTFLGTVFSSTDSTVGTNKSHSRSITKPQ
jgi:hypothetical protein